MSSTLSPHGFSAVRGRGYRPAQVDARLDALLLECAELREQDGRLTVLARELSDEADRLRAVVAALPEPTFASLGERASRILREAEEQATELAEMAAADTEQLRAEAREAGQALCDAAEEIADKRREEAAGAAEDAVGEMTEQARDLLATAEAEATQTSRSAREELAEVARRSTVLLERQEKDHQEQRDAVTSELTRREAENTAAVATLEERGETVIAAAKRAYAEAEQASRRGLDDAQAQAGELVAEAKVRADRVARETDRVVRAHEANAAELRAHLTHVRATLAALTGRDVEPVGAAHGTDGPGAPAE